LQAIVYTFMALAALALGVAGYAGLGFSPVEAALLAVTFAMLFVLIFERTLRRRSEARLESGIAALAQLLGTETRAADMLSQRLNALADSNADERLTALEGDLSVLGTVTRQIAEAVAEIDRARRAEARRGAASAAPVPTPARPASPLIPPETVERTIAEGGLVFHLMPVVTLPQRRHVASELVPRLVLPTGGFAESDDFIPAFGNDALRFRIDQLAAGEAITIARRARTAGEPVALSLAVSSATLGDGAAAAQLVALLDANRAVATGLTFVVAEAVLRGREPEPMAALAALVAAGAALSIANISSLRGNFGELANIGVRSVRVDAARLIEDPQAFTDYALTDVPAYLKRFGVDLIATGVDGEQMVLSLLEDGIGFAQGAHLGGPAPFGAARLAERPTRLAAGA
jgi:cyclic-di-GMP phosphodiesterase TipF (flagellum assembly factor)